MCCVTGTENVPPSAARCGLHSLNQPGVDGSISHFPDARFLGSAGAFNAPLKRNFQRGHHHLQLADIVRIGERYQPVSLTAGGRTA